MRLIAAVFLFVLTMGNSMASPTPLAMNDAFRLSVNRAVAGSIHLKWVMPPGYYLYKKYISATTADGIPISLTIGPGVEKDDENFGKSEVYFDSADADLGPVRASIVLTYQGCQEHGLCYPPARRVIDPTSLAISEQPVFSPPTVGVSAWSGKQTAGDSRPSGQPAGNTQGASTSSGDVVDRFLSRGGVPLLLAAFLGFGILLAFTPCVFPLYPILAATLAREGERLNARRGLLLSTSYAVGLAAAFAIFGAAAAWTGENLQIALQSPLTVAVVAVVFVSLALSMFGLFELQLPSSLITKISRHWSRQGGSIGSAAVLGFSSALIIGPCVTAPLAGALLYVARTGDVALGAALLFMLGLGKGVPLIIFGTLGAQALPRAGAWMDSVKQVFGFVFFALAVWTAEPLLAEWMPMILWATWAMAAAVFLGAFDVTKGGVNPTRMGLQALGLLASVYAVLLIVGLAGGAVDPLQPLDGIGNRQALARAAPAALVSISSKAEFASQIEAAGSEGKASLVYFTADWCVSCRSIERNVFSKPEVIDALSHMKTLKVDLTSVTSAQRALMQELEVVGPPTMIVFRPDRRPVDDRLIGEFSAGDLLKAVSAAKAGT